MAYKKCLIATTKNLFDINSVSFFTKDSNGEYKSNKRITESDILWTPVDGTKQVTISGYIKCPIGKKYMFRIVYTDGTDLYRDLISTGNYIYQTITSNSSKVVSFIGLTYYDSSDQVYLKDVQIEYGSTATSYVPYGYLPSYKKIIKVNNNPVQLLNKNQYESSLTRKGITFTNNNDGTVTVNGTATANVDFGLFGSEYNYTEKLLDGKYLILGCPSNGGENSYRIYIQGNYGSSYSPTATDTGSGAFMNYSSNSYPNRKFGCWITIISGYTANNLIFKPQLYNLTAMFGEGNEPSTVAEFRAKYPNDYYEYNHSQYLVSYRKNLITDGSTKNLFDINSVSFFTKDSNGEYKSNKRITESDILWTPVDGTKQVTISGYIKCPIGKKYMFRIVYTDGTDLYRDLISTGNYIYQTITSNSSKVVSFIGLTYYDSSDQVYLKDVQIEYSSTATSYVPYQYL